MRAIIQTGGKQFTVAPEKTIRVPSLVGEPGDEVTFDRVLYVADADSIHVGTPAVGGATVTAEIVKHGRGKKIVVFKYKRRKRYSRKKGHRQNFTELRITGVNVDAEAARGSEAAGEPSVLVCEKCGKEYKTERGLAQHRIREHGGAKKKRKE
jgi:large subunit ribosomal protein L21